MKKTLVAAVLAVLAVTTSACGGGDEDKAAQAISDSIMQQQKSSGSQFMKVERKDADCVGEGFVDKIGVDKLQEYGMITDDLKVDKSVDTLKMSTDDAESAADVFTDCTDVVATMKKAMSQAGEMPPAVKDCMDKALSEDAMHDMLVSLFSGKQNEATTKLQTDITKCVQQGMGGTQ